MAARDGRSTYQRRDARAKALGFSGYREQRQARARAVRLAPALRGNRPEQVRARDDVALFVAGYEPQSMTRAAIVERLTDADSGLFDEEFFESDEWWDFLDEISPKKT